MSFLLTLTNEEVRECSGAFPRFGFCVGTGYSREEFKDVLLAQGARLTRWSVFGLTDLCLHLYNNEKNEKISLIQDFQAELVLETLLKDERVRKFFPKTVTLLDHKNIYKKLVDSLSVFRMSFSHEEEKIVLLEKMKSEEDHQSQLRDELILLCQVYEEWIFKKNLVDLPLLLLLTKEKLEEEGWPFSFPFFPEKIILLQMQVQESRELSFWEALSRFIEIEKRGMLFENKSVDWNPPQVELFQAHTLQDSAEFFFQDLKTQTLDFTDFSNSMLLIPDEPEVRRTLVRIFESQGIPLVEDRDPTFVRLSEELKKALLPLELKTSGFSFEKVSEYIYFSTLNLQVKKEISEFFFEKGWKEGLSLFQEHFPETLQEEFNKIIDLDKKWKSEFCFSDFKATFIQNLIDHSFSVKALQVYEKLLDVLEEALRITETLTLPQSLNFWMQKIQSLLRVFPPLVAPKRPAQGVQLYRMNQMSTQWYLNKNPSKKLFIFSLPKGYLSEPEVKSLFWTDWERDVLSVEFNVRGPRIIKKERIQTLKTWMSTSKNVSIYDFHFTLDGAERPSPLTEISFLDPAFSNLEIKTLGVSPRWEESFQFHPKYLNSEINMSPHEGELSITASALDEYSRCPYRALVRQRWKLEDIRAPHYDIYPDIQGQILHKCVEIILREGLFQNQDLPQVIKKAFQEIPLKGTIPKKFLLESIQKKFIPVLEVFLEEEMDYQKKSGATVFDLESKESIVFHGKNGKIRGRADRIDLFKEGLVVIDYKTSSDLPSAKMMIEDQYRLQMPFYAVALSKKTSKEVYGCQFVALTRGGGRGRGIFFKKFNGKEEGRLTHLRSNSQSLVDQEPRDLWLGFEDVLESTLLNMKKGIYHARPQYEEECDTCFAYTLCGKARGFEKKSWTF